MESAAQHQVFVVSDSDVLVTPDYLRAVVAPLADDGIGLVTCLYRGVALPATMRKDRSFWANLEAVGMSVEMTSGVLVAEMLEGMAFALGPTMVVRRDCLERAGGFASLVDITVTISCWVAWWRSMGTRWCCRLMQSSTIS